MAENEDIYGDVSSLEDIREINEQIRKEMHDVGEQAELTELKKRADYLCALTLSPSWQSRFGDRSPRFLEVAREEDERTTRIANDIAQRKGFDVEYH